MHCNDVLLYTYYAAFLCQKRGSRHIANPALYLIPKVCSLAYISRQTNVLVQTQLRRRCEQMHLRWINLDLHGVANLWKSTWVHANSRELILIRHHSRCFLRRTIGDDIAIDIAIRTEIFHVHYLQGERIWIIGCCQACICLLYTSPSPRD